MASLMARAGDVPIDEEDAHFVTSTSTFAQSLEMTLDEREKIKHANGNYYICVKGHVTSTYTLTVQPQTEKVNYYTLEDGYVETFKISPEQMQIFVYRVPDLEYVNEDITLKFEVSATHGQLPMLFGKYCNKKDVYNDCTTELSIDELKKEKKGF